MVILEGKTYIDTHISHTCLISAITPLGPMLDGSRQEQESFKSKSSKKGTKYGRKNATDKRVSVS